MAFGVRNQPQRHKEKRELVNWLISYLSMEFEIASLPPSAVAELLLWRTGRSQ